jgi:hypothetical protein
MPIRILLKDDLAFPPEDAKVLIAVFENTLKALRLVDRDDPLTHLLARKVVNACNEDFRRLVQAALLTGCRYSELTQLRASATRTSVRSPSA